MIYYQIKDDIDILMITETKLNESFPIGQFFMDGFSTPVLLVPDRNVGGILLHIREDIPSKLLSIENKLEAFL